MKFKEIKAYDADVMIRSHQHIDNGGHTVSVDRFHNIVIETGFFGYSQTTVQLSTVDIDGLIEILQEAKRRMEEDRLARKLRGEE
jgi:hypothetical protein